MFLAHILIYTFVKNLSDLNLIINMNVCHGYALEYCHMNIVDIFVKV